MMWDVVVSGGGVSGAAAAIAAARLGAKTLVIEKEGYCGGALTGMGVGPMMTFHAGKRRVIGGIAQEIVERLIACGGSPGHITDTTLYASSITPFDSEKLKCVLDDLLREAGVRVLYHAYLCGAKLEGGIIRSAEVCTKQGIISIEGRVFISAEGDADLARCSGADTAHGRDKDGLTQPMTTNMKVYGVDIARLKKAIADEPENFNVKGVELMRVTPRLAMAGFYRQLSAAQRRGDVFPDRESILLFETANEGEVIINTTRVVRLDPTDAWELSEAEAIGRAQARQIFDLLCRECEGFESARLVSTGDNIGVRESIRLKGRYILNESDLLSSRRFDDTIALGGYPIDIHNPEGTSTDTHHLAEGQFYYIPYRALLAREPQNLLVPGRAMSATHEAQAAIRVTPIAMATGQAAGAAAALSALRGITPEALPYDALRSVLISQGAILE